MSNIKINLNQFKHVKSTPASTTLQHPDGHQITLAHSALSKQNQQALTALSKIPKDVATADQHRESQSDQLCSGGEVKMAGGGIFDDLPNPFATNPANSAPAATGHAMSADDRERYFGREPKPPLPKAQTSDSDSGAAQLGASYNEYVNGKANGGKIQKYAEGTPDQPIVSGSADAPYEQAPQAEAPSSEPSPQVKPASEPTNTDPNFEKKMLYNQQLSGIGGSVSQDDMFGPNGELPKNPVNPSVWNNVEASSQANQDAASEVGKRAELDKQTNAVKQQQMLHEKAVAQNAVNSKLGAPLVPDPGAPVTPNDESPAQDPGNATQQSLPDNSQPQQSNQPQQQDPMMQMPNAPAMLANAYSNEMQAANKTLQAQQQQIQANAPILSQAQQSQNEVMQQYQNTVKQMTAHQADLEQAVKDGEVDPEKFWHGDKNGNGSHSKLLAGLGMIIAGFNPTSNPNAAIGFIKSQIENNLNAQAKNLDAKQNLLRYNLMHMNNMRDAADMTRLQLADLTKMKLQEAANKTATPMAEANRLKAIGDINREFAPLRMDLDLRQTAASIAGMPVADAGSDVMRHASLAQMYEQMGKLDQANAIRQRIVPGIGVSRTGPVSDTNKAQMLEYNKLQNMFQQSLQFSNLSPAQKLDPRTIAAANTLHGQLIGEIKQAQHDGVYKPSEADFLTTQLGNSPTSLLSGFSSAPKVRELQQLKQHEYQNLLQQSGIPQYQGQQPQAQPQEGPVEGATATNHKTGQRLIFRNGRWQKQ